LCVISLQPRQSVPVGRKAGFQESGASSNRWRNITFSLEISRQWLDNPDLMLGNCIGWSCRRHCNQAERRIAMARQVTKKKKQDKRPTDRVQLVQKRFMEIDVDPGHDAEFGWIDKAEDTETERTPDLKGNRLGTANSKRRED
jgi:hypothetical protein